MVCHRIASDENENVPFMNVFLMKKMKGYQMKPTITLTLIWEMKKNI